MIKNIFLNITRNIRKNLSNTTMSIAGLAIGLSSFMIVLSYVNYEFGFDKHFSDYENTYRFTTDLIWENGDRQTAAVSPTPSAKHLVKDFPEITDATCFFTAPKTLFTLKEENSQQSYFEEYLLFTDEHFPNLFDVQMHRDQAAKILQEPNSLIISESINKKFFKGINPVGKVIQVEGSGDWTIKGVMEDHPVQSHIKYNVLASIAGQEQFATNVWRTMNAYTYFKALPSTNMKELEAKFEGLVDRYLPVYKNMLQFRLQPLRDIHLKNDRSFDYAITSNLKNIYLLLSIGIIILIITSFNYSNLLLSKNKEHLKEMGIRKIIGATKTNIFSQLFLKGIFIASISTFLGIIIAKLSLPFLNKMFDYQIEVSFLNYFSYSVIILLITGIISVTFPAISMAQINPVNVLNNFREPVSKRKLGSQKLSLIVQFALAIVLISGAIVTYKQVLFLKNKQLGFNAEDIMIIEIGNNETYRVNKVLKNELLKHPGILNVAQVNTIPGGETFSEHFQPEGFDNYLPLNIFNVDADFVQTLNIRILAGRNFNKTNKQDSAACLINESTLRKLGWNLDEAIGKTMKWNFAQKREDQIDGKVIGVIKDFHFRSLHQPIEELVITSHTNEMPVLLVKLLPEQLTNSAQYIKNKFIEANPGVPFEYSFLKTGINKFYKKDDELRILTALFSAIAVLISCLGIYSYSIAIYTKKVKEIGIRKVNGAKVREILAMLNKDFVKWVAIAFAVAFPIAWYAMNKWLENFAYKTTLSWWIFALAGVLALGIALLTVSFQSWKAATRNPVEALRYE